MKKNMTLKKEAECKNKPQNEMKKRKEVKIEDDKPVIISENMNNHHDLEYISSLLHELKILADQSGYKLLYHLINMAEIESIDIQKLIKSKIE